VLRVLPSLEIAATGEELTTDDRLWLDRYAERVSDRVWRLQRARLLATLEEGGSAAELRELLLSRSIDPLPEEILLFEDGIYEILYWLATTAIGPPSCPAYTPPP